MSKKAKNVISRDMNFAGLINDHPECAEVFMKHGMHCLGCALAHFETIGQGAEAHGIDIDKLIADLKKAVKK